MCHLIGDFQQLEAEREAARKMAGRFVGISSQEYASGGGKGSTFDKQPVSGGYREEKTAAEWTGQTAAFEPPKYAEPNLFTPPPQKQLIQPAIEPIQVKQPVKPAAKPLTSIFEIPTKPAPVPPPQEISLFDPVPIPPQPLSTQPPSQPQVSTSLFTVPTKPQVSIFTMPTAQQRPEPIKPASKPEPKSAGIFTLESGSPKLAKPSLLGSEPSSPPVKPAEVSSALDGIFSTTQPAFPAPSAALPKPGSSSPPSGIRHNMAVYSGSSISQLQTFPLVPETKPEPKKPINLENLLVDLDNLKVEGSKPKQESTHLQGFGVST